MAEVVVGDLINSPNLPKINLPTLDAPMAMPEREPLRITIGAPLEQDDDVEASYLAARKDANAPSSFAWGLAAEAGVDPGEAVLNKPVFDYIETRTDGGQQFKVGIDRDNPDKSVILETLDFAEDVGAGLGKGAVKGLQDAGTELGDFMTNGFWSSTITPWMQENVPYLDEANKAAAEALKPEGAVQEVTAAFTAPMAQVVAPGSIFTRTFRAAGISTRILAETLGYSAAEIAAVDPKDATLMELGLQLIDDDPEIKNIVEQAFAAQESESDFMQRVKNMPRKIVEGGVTGVIAERTFDAIGMAYRAMKNSRVVKEAAQRSAEGKSPIPVGMSIEDVGKGDSALQTVDDPTLAPSGEPQAPQVINAIESESDNPNSLVNMLYNNPERQAVLSDPAGAGVVRHKDGKPWNKARLAEHMDKAAKAAGRTIKEWDDKSRNILSDTIANEAIAALQKQGNASDWYNTKLIEMNTTLQKIHPEMLPGTAEEGVFKLGLSLTSNGATVDYNLRAADHIYSIFKQTGKFPEDLKSLTAAVGGFGREGPTLIKQMKTANRLISKLKPQGFADFLNSKVTVRELETAGFKLSGEGKDYETYGSAIFGPKIGGGFYQNLRGNFEPVTFDRWWMGSWGRWTGNAMQVTPKATQIKQLDRFKAAMADTGGKQMSTKEANLKAAKKMFTKYVRDGFQPRTELNIAAQRLVEGAKKTMREQPGGPTERKFMREVAYETVAKMKEMGYDVTPADLQATVWYPEKDLHGSYKIGSGSSAPDDYAAAAKRLLENR